MKRIILVGPGASGKTFIRDKFREKGFTIDVSWTSRPMREGEVQDIDYHFVYKEKFEKCIDAEYFYEWVKFGDDYYGTEAFSWNCKSEIFIMETEGISKIKPEDRNDCLIVYVNTPENIRLERMVKRGWNAEKIKHRISLDKEKFFNFVDYDIEISSNVNNSTCFLNI